MMDKLRAFRHRERNTYGMNLDFEIVIERATEAVTGFERFSSEVRLFFLALDTAERIKPAPTRHS